MVAQAHTTPLPTLSRPDKLRLTLYFACGQSVEILAHDLLQIHRTHQAHLADPTKPSANFPEALLTENTALSGIPPTQDSAPRTQDSPAFHSATFSPPPPDSYDLAAWTLSDTIAPHIAYRRAESVECRKQSALQQLDTILATSDSPIEKRRAATTMLRMLASQLTRNRVPSSPAGGGPALRGGGGGVSTPSTHSPSRQTQPTPRITPDSSSPHLPIPQSPHPHPSNPGPSEPSVASSPPQHSALSPQHSAAPDAPAKALLRLALKAIMSPQDLTARAALEPHLTPQATINHEPILSLESQLSAISPKLEVHYLVPDDSGLTLSPGPPETRSSICSLYQTGRSNRYQITLTRAHSSPWLLDSINPVKDTS